MTFGEWLKDELKARHWSITELARRMDVSPGSVSRWAADQRVPDVGSCLRLAQALDVSGSLVLARAGHRTERDVRREELTRELEKAREWYEDAQKQMEDLPHYIHRLEEELQSLNEMDDAEDPRVDRIMNELWDLPLQPALREEIRRRVYDALRTESANDRG